MYTYNQTFFGIPLSQIDDFECNETFKEILQSFASDHRNIADIRDMTQQDIADMMKDFNSDKNIQQLLTDFIAWLKDNFSELEKHQFKFLSSYHGGDEYPMIFGVYGGFNLPDFGCSKIDTSKLMDVVKKETEIKQLFSTIPKQLIEAFAPFGNTGFWCNNHSS